MSSANPHWSARRIHGELQKLGIHLAQATVAKYMVRHRKPSSIRRECLDHFIVFHERGLHRSLKSYFEYYERSRIHLSLGKDAPLTRAIHLPEMGRVIELPQVGGHHHRYETTGSLSNGFLFKYIHRPRGGGSSAAQGADMAGRSRSTIRQVFSETEEFIPSRVLLTLLQHDRIFGRDSPQGDGTTA